ncbi:nitrogen fixation protein NifQ [Telmatospirillum sp.]|uniref:nitrogen fixation protein NifQ n=1 Tax=Telmatospirillum sp. TaxID=2079197 RepID=UPI0028467769|nr:nitrogen fixation protein NifQ [Telmatospirillum sp.]MDR3437077.1 nitrogen fixation protein NifQ [Telmatospirillum sp.]
MTAVPAGSNETYRRLMAAAGRREPFDSHVFACVLAVGLQQERQSLWDFLGLTPAVLRVLLASYFPSSGLVIPSLARSQDEEAIEEEDFRLLLLSYRARNVPEEEWLAAIVARRAQADNHLWEDLGLASRDDLNGLIRRHFPALFAKNDKNMRWKKFFYRMMCESEGLRLCKSPNCQQCPDLALCFEPDSVLIGNRSVRGPVISPVATAEPRFPVGDIRRL